MVNLYHLFCYRHGLIPLGYPKIQKKKKRKIKKEEKTGCLHEDDLIATTLGIRKNQDKEKTDFLKIVFWFLDSFIMW